MYKSYPVGLISSKTTAELYLFIFSSQKNCENYEFGLVSAADGVWFKWRN